MGGASKHEFVQVSARARKMSLFKYFKRERLPAAENTGVAAKATESANAVLSTRSIVRFWKKKKRYLTFSDEERAQIGRFLQKMETMLPLRSLNLAFLIQQKAL